MNGFQNFKAGFENEAGKQNLELQTNLIQLQRNSLQLLHGNRVYKSIQHTIYPSIEGAREVI